LRGENCKVVDLSARERKTRKVGKFFVIFLMLSLKNRGRNRGHNRPTLTAILKLGRLSGQIFLMLKVTETFLERSVPCGKYGLERGPGPWL
jgi:hypothetical protein